jgi:RNA-directed DNA polymerase
MTADRCAAGAASRAEEGWHTINWGSAHRIVCRLQARIVKAIQAGRWGEVKALQYLLTQVAQRVADFTSRRRLGG